jgi:hypothetical protein
VASAGLSADDPFLLLRMAFRSLIVDGAWEDGNAGAAGASISTMSEYLGMLTRWERSGCPDKPLTPTTKAGLRVARAAVRALTRLRVRLRDRPGTERG